MHTFNETLTCLAGQTDTDFEVLVLGHRLPYERQLAVERAIDDSPTWLRERIRLILVNKGNRTHPLNVGFENARGRYIGILDDDDIPFANWVETFRELDAREPGKILRAATVRQDVKTANVGRRAGLRAEGPLDLIYPSSFDLFEHLRTNQTPPVCLAFPRGVFHDLKIRFDEELSTTEDWDFLLRVAAIVGVASSPQITSVYRWWVSEECARLIHPVEEWQANHGRILHKIDGMMFLFPKGTTKRIRHLLDHYELPASSGQAARVSKPAANLTVLRYPRMMLKWIRYTRKRRKYRSELEVIKRSSLFDRRWYLEMYPDVAEAGIDPALHYILSGACELRHPGPNFDSAKYLRCNPDVGAAGVNPLVHYMECGRSEGRPIYKVTDE
jgi:glycosyltransferase involved in cell wall biosynthesis